MDEYRRLTRLVARTRRSAAILVCVAVLTVLGAPVSSAQIVFVKIVDTDTAIPGGTGTFTHFPGPYQSTDGQGAAFVGSGDSQTGVYVWKDGTLSVVADLGTAIPGGSGNFTTYGPASIDAGKVAFEGIGGFNQNGLYSNVGGGIVTAVDTGVAIPGGTGNFFGFSPPILEGTTIVFKGWDSVLNEGVYTGGVGGGGVAVVADENTAIPLGTGNFTNFDLPFLEDGAVAFRASGVSQKGIYSTVGGSLSMVADTATAIPGGVGNFTDFGVPPVSLDQGAVCFRGLGSSGQSGIYTNYGGSLRVVADENTTIPGDTILFSGFDDSAISGSRVAFRGSGPGVSGIYLWTNGSIMKIIDSLDSLESKEVNSLYLRRAGLNGPMMVFYVTFDDGSRAIYAAILAAIFADGFESGDLSRWSSN